MSPLHICVEKWFLRNRPSQEYQFDVALSLPISDQKWIDSLLTVSLISEIEFCKQTFIGDQLIFSMRESTLGEFLFQIESEDLN